MVHNLCFATTTVCMSGMVFILPVIMGWKMNGQVCCIQGLSFFVWPSSRAKTLQFPKLHCIKCTEVAEKQALF